MADINLPFWLSGQHLNQVKQAAEAFWQQVQAHVDWSSNQIDALNCDQQLLELLAWERDIKRLADEDEATYRLRVKHAYANAKDAGSVEGFKRIFARLGVRYLEILERQPDLDWDIITVELEDNELSNKQALIEGLIQHYGRTCRRYVYSLANLVEVDCGCGEFDYAQANNNATVAIAYSVENSVTLTSAACAIDHDELTMVASL